MIDPDVQEIKDSISKKGLKGFSLESIFTGLCEAVSAKFNLYRGSIGMPTLHPLVEATTLRWNRDTGLEFFESEHGYSEKDDWRLSPIPYMFDHKLENLRYRLDQPGDWQKFPLLGELAQSGCTDYYAVVISFNDTAYPSGEDVDGMLTSWATKEKGGFSDDFFQALSEILPALGIVSKLTARENATVNILNAYLGKDAGSRVLNGQIQHGEIVSIEAVIWYSDMRNSTSLAEKLSNQDFLDTLNTYFECTAGSILENGGEVLRFIGDAVLAIFPIETFNNAEKAAQSAWQAAIQARLRINLINPKRESANQELLDFGLALHAGSLDYGNIGIPTRLEFSVIGSVANEVARLEGLTKILGEPILVSDSFARLLEVNWKSLGPQKMKGVKNDPIVYAPNK